MCSSFRHFRGFGVVILGLSWKSFSISIWCLKFVGSSLFWKFWDLILWWFGVWRSWASSFSKIIVLRFPLAPPLLRSRLLKAHHHSWPLSWHFVWIIFFFVLHGGFIFIWVLFYFLRIPSCLFFFFFSSESLFFEALISFIISLKFSSLFLRNKQGFTRARTGRLIKHMSILEV